MPVKPELVALYHEYLAVVNNQAAAASLLILDVLGQGEPRVHYLLTGDDPEQVIVRDEKVEVVPKGEWVHASVPQTKVRAISQEQALAEAAAEKEATAKKQEDEWGTLLKAYKKLKHGG